MNVEQVEGAHDSEKAADVEVVTDANAVRDCQDATVVDAADVRAGPPAALYEGAAVGVTTTELDVVETCVRQAGTGGGAFVVAASPPMPKMPPKNDLALLAKASASLAISSPMSSSCVGTCPAMICETMFSASEGKLVMAAHSSDGIAVISWPTFSISDRASAGTWDMTEGISLGLSAR